MDTDDRPGRPSPATSGSAGTSQPLVDGIAGAGGPERERRRQDRRLHLGRQERGRRGRPRRHRTGSPSGPPTPRTTGPRSRKVVTVDRRRGGGHASARRRASSRPTATATPTRTTLSMDGRRGRSPGRPASSTRTARPSGAGRSPRRPPGVDLERPRTRPARIVADGRYTFRVNGLDRAGNQTVRDLTVRVDRTIRSVTWARSSFDPASGPEGPADARPAPAGDASRSRSTRVRRWSAGSGPVAASRPARTAGRGAARRPPARSSSPARYRVVVDATSWIGSSRSPGASIGQGPVAADRPSRLAPHDRHHRDADRVRRDPGAARRRATGVWVVLPTYDEAENIGPIVGGHPRALPGGDAARRRRRLARRHRAARRRARRRRPARPGPPPAGQAGPRARLPRRLRRRPRGRRDRRRPDGRRLQPRSGGAARASSAPIADGTADLVIGSRYTKGGGVVDWGIGRRIVSRGGSMFARIVLGLGQNDLTGGFKAWRASTLAAVPFDGVHAGGYVFQIEMTFRASRAGARIREVPITFRDRRVGQSQDEPADRRRGAGRRRPAPGRGARSGACAAAPRVVTGS